MQDQSIEWRDGNVPVSTRFDDPYFSLEDGLAETRHVFLAGNDLPARFAPGFHIAELGFGTGLNFLATLDAFRSCGATGKLRFTSFEAYPLSLDDLRIALAPFPMLPTDIFIGPEYDDDTTLVPKISGDDFDLEVIFGDARETLPLWEGQADAWFLDGFSPAKNPELWTSKLMAEVGAHTKPGGTAATYTAAGFVRRGLEDAGFAITRVPGFGRKRHMTRAVKR